MNPGIYLRGRTGLSLFSSLRILRQFSCTELYVEEEEAESGSSLFLGGGGGGKVDNRRQPSRFFLRQKWGQIRFYVPLPNL